MEGRERMGLLIWFGCGLLGVIIWLFTVANCLSDDAEDFREDFLSGGALIVYVLMILVGFFGLCLMVLGSFIVFACWFAENVSTSKKIGHGLYKLLRRKKRDD